MSTWRLIDSGACGAAFNMALDEALAVSVRKGESPVVLRLYTWEAPAVSLGAFQDISDIDLDYCSRNSIPVVRRPTGGRAILHGDELTYSFSAGITGVFSGGLMESYRLLGRAFNLAFKSAGLDCSMKKRRESGRKLTGSPLCFSSSSLGEISSNGIKIIGSAQKRWRDGFLQQGSIPFTIDLQRLKMVFGNSGRGIDSSFSGGLRELSPGIDGGLLKHQIIRSFEETFSATLEESQPSPQELELALRLESTKYLDQFWTRGARADNLSGSNANILRQE